MYKSGFDSKVPLMIRTKLIEDQLRREQLDDRALDNMLRRRIEEGGQLLSLVSVTNARSSALS
jgi:hypothetical protein